MKSFLTDDKNDLKLDDVGNLAIGEDINAVVQMVQNRLNTVRGEIQLDIEQGVPYFETVLGKQTPNVTLWESYMISEAEAVDGVISVDNIQSRVENNELKYEMTILTIYGKAKVEG